MKPLPESERNNARVKPSLKREDRQARINEVIEDFSHRFDGMTLHFHLRICGTCLFSIASRPIDDIPVDVLERVAQRDYTDPICSEMREEARLDLKRDIDKANAWLEGVA